MTNHATDSKALREKLDAMVRNNLTPSILNCYQTQYASARQVVLESISLTLLAENQTLLREKEERETPCVWNHIGGEFQEGCDKVMWLFFAPKFCPGCGHPVQVKQNEEK